MTSTPPPPVTITAPDGQVLRGHLHARRQVPDGWLYRVGIVLWQAPDPDHPTAGEYVAWMPATHVEPVPGADYSAVETTRLPQDIPPPAPPLRRPTPATQWRIERERRPYTQTTERTTVHRSDCPTAGDGPPIDTQTEARAAMAQPGARGCAICGTDQSLT
ncbi:DUF6233 domain-containing protein [Streptomyces sp. NPDC002913]